MGGPGVDPELFSSEVTTGDGEVVVAVRGEIDVVTAPLLWETFAELLPDTKRLVVDLQETAFIDSTGLGVLVPGAQATASSRRRAGAAVS